ncbi:hypothetical protein J4N45_25935 [Vibrio sp. SCSIO 43140]|uniref:hypothetical protein n=1 Tax=Vibrio sp. SCSIO 43140 TaxID=2819100 RepID=UPI00207541E6|nr:hypothetical protein [Vibrio sp. SCSIO 43140]USD62800.1 hypothetical protein J4N45_25935 [Vibrio sp. SCSIO 43140]
MNESVKNELGRLLVNQEALLEVLSKSHSSLTDYPELQDYLARKNPNVTKYNRALREGQFTRQEFLDEIGERLNWLAYELQPQIDMDFLVERVATLVGHDIEKIKSLTIEEIGADLLSKLINLYGTAIYSTQQTKPSYPFLATKGQVDHEFWKQSHIAYDAWVEGYQSHYKLTNYCQDKLDCKAPQSSVRFFRQFGDPRDIPEWREYAGYNQDVSNY